MEAETAVKKKSLFRNKNFTLSFLGALVSNMGGIFYSFAVGYYILAITNNNAIIQGVYLASTGLIYCISCLFGGVITDRFNKAKIMYICDFMTGASILASFVLMWIFNDATSHLIVLFVVGVLTKIIGGIFSPASSAIIPVIVEDDRIQEATSLRSILSSFQSILGVVLAGILYSTLPIFILFLVTGLCYVASAISEMFIKYQFVKQEEKLTLKSTFLDIKDGFKYTISYKALFSFMVIIVFINFFFTPVSSNFGTYFISSDVKSASSYLLSDYLKPEYFSAIFSSIIAVGSIAGSIIYTKAKQKDKCCSTVVMWLFAITFMLMALAFGYLFLVDFGYSLNAFLILVLIGCFPMGFVLSCVNIPINTSILRHCDPEKLGKTSAVIEILSSGLIPLASLIAGFIIDGFGCSAILFVSAGGLLVCTLFLLFNKSARDF